MARRRPRWYFSFRSPYSWMAYRDLMADHRDVAERIDWLPFWEPDETASGHLEQAGIHLPYVAMSKEKHLYILQDVRRLARDRGLEMVWPVDRRPRWEVAHLAYLVADELGHGREFIALVYRARWEEGRDISDPAVIAEIAERLGLDAVRLSTACDDPAVREHGLGALNSLYRDGVFGVPFFIDGYEKFWGVDRLPGFASSVRSSTA
ncbi:2-hydroxychromene-2-carboxylate isomerase [Streptomyces sp. NBC_01618]|uniref:2-hydroxychromene-2-carboxylate isomerase n=1 Tax=Streptomyces sp. NBC_01618 TaxID=2975900 RepID=UPI003866AD9C|nr:DsbA family protein [Streptomyces sp. NBC_01618]